MIGLTLEVFPPLDLAIILSYRITVDDSDPIPWCEVGTTNEGYCSCSVLMKDSLANLKVGKRGHGDEGSL